MNRFIKFFIVVGSTLCIFPIVACLLRLPNYWPFSIALRLTAILIVLSSTAAHISLKLLDKVNLLPSKKRDQLPYQGLFLSLGVVALYLSIFSGSEQYFSFYPSIDTVYSKNYNEDAFQELPLGSTKEDVLKAIGKPLNITYNHSEIAYEKWTYSSDGRCNGWCDFAWLGRAIYFNQKEQLIDKWNIIVPD